MEEDYAIRLEHMEKAHQELQEKHAKTCDDVSRIMEMLTILTKGMQNERCIYPFCPGYYFVILCYYLLHCFYISNHLQLY